MVVGGLCLGITGISVKLMIRDAPDGSKGRIRHGKPINFFTAWKLPGVGLCAVTYGGVKMLNYAFIMWLPYYL